MALPTLRLTFAAMQLRVAEYLGVNAQTGSGSNAVNAVPTHLGDLDIVKRLINDGYRDFVNANPNGWRFMKPEISITLDPTGAAVQCVNAEPWRYYLPDGCIGELVSPWTFAEGVGLPSLQEVGEGEIRGRRAEATVTGDPFLCAHRPLTDDLAGTNHARFELLLWPTPATVRVISARAALWPDELSADDDVSVCGVQHDKAVLAFALREAEMRKLAAPGPMAAAAAEALQSAFAVDRNSAPRRLGYNLDRSDGPIALNHSRWDGVVNLNGSPV